MNEYDGYLLLDDGFHLMHMAWHVLPRKAANLTVDTNELDFTENSITFGIANTGVGIAQIVSCSLLLVVSEKLPEGGPREESPIPVIRAVGVATLEDVPVDVCSDASSIVWQFAISTWKRQRFYWCPTLDGRKTVFSVDLHAFSTESLFFAERSMNTADAIISVYLEQIGINQTDLRSTKFNVCVQT